MSSCAAATLSRSGPARSFSSRVGSRTATRRLVPGEGHLLGIAVPAGLDGFFRTIAGGAASVEASEQTYAAASERYGIPWIG
jgi:hypothetical protein